MDMQARREGFWAAQELRERQREEDRMRREEDRLQRQQDREDRELREAQRKEHLS